MADLHDHDNDRNRHQHLEHKHEHDCAVHGCHEHIHKHDGCQDDEHLHNHGQLYADPDEVPAVFSQTFDVKLQKEFSLKEIKESLHSWLSDLQTKLKDENSFIGHLKAYAEYSPEESLWLSTTGDEISLKEIPEGRESSTSCFVLNITAIVYGTDEASLENVVMQELGNKLGVITISKL